MAHTVMMKQKASGITKKGFYGFSWTTLFFGALPALFRMDFMTFLGAFVLYGILGWLSIFSGFIFLPIGLAIAVTWAFLYNGYYTKRLLERGYVFDDDPSTVQHVCRKLNVSPPAPSALPGA